MAIITLEYFGGFNSPHQFEIEEDSDRCKELLARGDYRIKGSKPQTKVFKKEIKKKEKLI